MTLISASPALAQDPTDAQYGSTLELIDQGGSVTSTGPTSDAGGGLPFTGLDVVALGAVAVALFGAGLFLARHSRRRRDLGEL